MLQNTSQGHKVQANPPATQEPSTTPRTTNQQQDMIKTQNLAYDCPPPFLTLPTQHTTATLPAPHQLITTPHHSMLSLIQPADPQSLHPPQTSALAPQTHYPTFPRIVIHLNPTPHTSIPRMGTSERHKWVQLRMTIFFYGK